MMCGLVRKVGIVRPYLHLKGHLNPRFLTTASVANSLRRSYLYVPCSSERKLQKSLQSDSDVLIYDLEDSISPAPDAKAAARMRLESFLTDNTKQLESLHVAVRVNGLTTPFFQHDIAEIASRPGVQTLIMPKIHSAADLDKVSFAVHDYRQHNVPPLQIVSSIESARGLLNLGSIAAWKSKMGPSGGVLSAILFAAEDYCADTSVIRSGSRQELLYARSQVVVAAKAFCLDAIDMVCIDYKDMDILEDECLDGRQLGFGGKQAIHPSQVEIINKTFIPTENEILFAAKIIKTMQEAHKSETGAVGLEGRMIDAPMIKQAQRIVQIARAAKLGIPDLS